MLTSKQSTGRRTSLKLEDEISRIEGFAYRERVALLLGSGVETRQPEQPRESLGLLPQERPQPVVAVPPTEHLLAWDGNRGFTNIILLSYHTAYKGETGSPTTDRKMDSLVA